MVVHPAKGNSKAGTADPGRLPAARLAEAVGLAQAIDLQILAAEIVPLNKPRPATLLGSGTVDRLAALVKQHEITLVVIDAHVTPGQQRNLEKALDAKVIDRTGLILEIFGARARTREGTLQVELAALTYQKSRLVRSWTHLERQRGGFGFLGGPGETQIEADRRMIGDRIVRLKKELVEVKRTRDLHRQARKRVPAPIIALVGYTNAGKSTLFNRLTSAAVVARDQLFATLDPTMRLLTLPSGRKVILSDTVGFISDLPHELVAAFRATLEEVLEADLIIHVRDVAHPDSDSQRTDVETVLRELGIGEKVDQGLIEAWNKIDLLDSEDRFEALNQTRRDRRLVALSAATGEGIPRLLTLLDETLAAERSLLALDIKLEDGAALAWLYRHGDVVRRQDDEFCAHLLVRLDPADAGRFEQLQVL
jgi:GTP-binding protein HflX